jgi:hypothetical protein
MKNELQSIELFINVFIDYKNLKYFMNIKKLNKKQIKWAKFLTEFDFQIVYQTRKKSDKADLLIKRFNDRLINKSND